MSRKAPTLSLIAAVASNGIIGNQGALPWHLPEDLRFFKAQTLGHTVIMGRRTWEAIGRPLPGRRNIVVTRSPGFAAEGAVVAGSLDAALALCEGEAAVFIIGGAQVYRDALPRADRIVLTEIHRDYAGDARFPDFDRSRWREARREPHVAADGTTFDYVWYERP